MARLDSTIFASAVLFDSIAGDPEWMPHPVRAIGWAASSFESAIRPRRQSRTAEFCAGTTMTLVIVVGSSLLARVLLATIRKRPGAGRAFEVALAASCIALRNLLEEANRTVRALELGDLAMARTQLARIVGRDTEHLNESEISRALIETLAESLSDGVIAPMFYLALGGVPLAIAYKAINTLDSMIGHRNQRYLYFGRAAARIDDLANLLPSRIAAIIITLTAAVLPKATAPHAARTWLSDGSKHASPNAGQPEAAMAGALKVRLGGANTYDGQPSHSPILGANYKSATVADAKRALRITATAGLFAAGLLWLCLRRGKRA